MPTRSLSLYDCTIPSYIQYLDSLRRFLRRAEQACATGELVEAQLLVARLSPDMLPLTFQVESAVMHSLNAVRAVICGLFEPVYTTHFETMAQMAAFLTAARDELRSIPREAVDSSPQSEVVFRSSTLLMSFDPTDFLLSFEQPNFYFHISMAYAIFRANGVALGKNDYLGALRFKSIDAP